MQRGDAYQTSCIFFVPDHFKTQEMCIRTGEVDPWQPDNVSDHIKTQEGCDDAISKDLCWKYLIDIKKWGMKTLIMMRSLLRSNEYKQR